MSSSEAWDYYIEMLGKFEEWRSIESNLSNKISKLDGKIDAFEVIKGIQGNLTDKNELDKSYGEYERCLVDKVDCNTTNIDAINTQMVTATTELENKRAYAETQREEYRQAKEDAYADWEDAVAEEAEEALDAVLDAIGINTAG